MLGSDDRDVPLSLFNAGREGLLRPAQERFGRVPPRIAGPPAETVMETRSPDQPMDVKPAMRAGARPLFRAPPPDSP